MGLDNRASGKYITILGGKFCIRVPQGTDGAVERVNKLGNTVYEKFYEKFTGNLVSIAITDGTYGKSWNFGFKDSEEVYTLQLSYSNSFATALLKMLPNINLDKEMVVSPSVKEVDGKSRSSLFVNQDGLAIKHAYTMENPNGLPSMEEKTVKGQKIWDDTARLEFLQKMVETTIIPKLNGAVANSNAVENPIDVAEDDEINPDDIPF